MEQETKKSTYNNTDYRSGDGMLTSVWGPSLWHYLHVMSFNYPINPTNVQKQKYQLVITQKIIINLYLIKTMEKCQF